MPKVFEKDPSHIKQETHHPAHEDDEADQDTVRTFLEWRAPSRPFRKKDNSYYRTIAIIVTLLILIAILLQEILLIGVLLALAFVTYVLGFVPPDDVDYKISTQGITIGEHFYFWDEMGSFWFTEKEGSKLLHIVTVIRFPTQLILVLGSEDEEKVKNVVAKYLPYHEIAPKSIMDKWAEGLQRILPLEKSHH